MSRELEQVARGLFWWEPPEAALAQPRRFLAQVMTLGTWEEVRAAESRLGLEAFRDALQHAPPGIFDGRSWAYWHAAAGEVREIVNLEPRPGGIVPAAAT